MYVVVIGGGNVGYYLTKELLASGHEVVVIEEDHIRARQIAYRFARRFQIPAIGRDRV